MPSGVSGHIEIAAGILGFFAIFKAEGSVKCPAYPISSVMEGDRPGIMEPVFCHLCRVLAGSSPKAVHELMAYT